MRTPTKLLFVAWLLLLGPGIARAQTRAFAANSIVIPMDTTYQTANAGIFAAYGLVYRLMQKGVTVYVIINPGKTAFNQTDFSITNNSGYPAARFVWSTGGSSTTGMPQPTISYLGAPFVIDALDYARVVNLLTTDPLFNGSSTFQTAPVVLHVAQQSFTAPVRETLDFAPPKIAIQATGTASLVFPHAVLADAGLASGGGTYPASPGSVYSDVPSCATIIGDGLLAGGFQILWSDGWPGDGCAGGATDVPKVFSAIGRFVDAGNAYFAAYQSIATGEATATGNFMITPAGDPISFVNLPNNNPGPTGPTQFASPYPQYGDLSFSTGNSQYSTWAPPTAPYAYKPGVQELYQTRVNGAHGTQDIETYTRKDDSLSKGPIFYFGGMKNEFAGRDPGGERIFLNSIFSFAWDINTEIPAELTRSAPIVTGDGKTYQGTYSSTAQPNTYPPVLGHFREYAAGALANATVARFGTLTADWDAASGIPGPTARTVFTAVAGNGRLAQTPFDLAHATTLAGPMNVPVASAPQTITAIRAGGFGGVDHSTAAIVGASTMAGSSSRPTVAYVGALDGMLHAIAVSGSGVTPGAELWAFIPPSQLGSIATYQAGVDGSPQVADAFVDTGGGVRSWRTLLAIPCGLFGGTVDVLDVTDPLNPAFLWEAQTPAGSFAMGAASGAAFGLIPGNNGAPESVVIVATNNAGTAGNGFNLYALDAGLGTIVWQWNHLYTRTQPGGTSIVPNEIPGVPAVIDSTGDGSLDDKVFLGDLDGRLWMVDATFKSGPPAAPLYDVGTSGQPIGASVALYRDASTLDLTVLAATGGRDWVPATTTPFLVAVDTHNGTTLFTTNLAAGERVYAEPTIAGGDAYVMTSLGTFGGNISTTAGDTGNVRRISLGTGAITATTAVKKGEGEVAVGGDGTVIAASAEGETSLGNSGRNATGTALDDQPIKPITAMAWIDLH